jgi:PIN like domain
LNTLNTEQQPKSTVFFLDKNHGLFIRDFLQALKIPVRVHKTLGWRAEMPDTEWIAECGKNNWVILSGDKKIETVPEERQAVIDAKCKVFMFDDSHQTTTHDWAASLAVARERILRLAAECDGPFFVTVKPCRSRSHISDPRFVTKAGGGWKIVELPRETKLEAPKQIASKKRQQHAFDFQESMGIQLYAKTVAHCHYCAQLLSIQAPKP